MCGVSVEARIEHRPALEHRLEEDRVEVKDMQVGGDVAEQEGGQRDQQALPELHLDDVAGFPADRFQDADLALFLGREAGGLFPGEDAEGEDRRGQQREHDAFAPVEDRGIGAQHLIAQDRPRVGQAVHQLDGDVLDLLRVGHRQRDVGVMPFRIFEEGAEVLLVHEDQVGADQFRTLRQHLGDDESVQRAGVGAEGNAVAGGQAARAFQRRADDDLATVDLHVVWHHEGVVGLHHGVVVVAPQAAFLLLHAANPADLLDVARRDQVVTTGDKALQHDFRRAGQHLLRLGAQRVGVQRHRGEHEHQQRVDEQQAEVFALAPCQRSEREINQVTLFFDPSVHKP